MQKCAMDCGRTFPVSNVLKSVTSRHYANDVKEANILDLNETVKLKVFYTAINGKNSTICYHDNLKKVQGFDTNDMRQLIGIDAKISSRKHRMCLKSHLLSRTITFEPRHEKTCFLHLRKQGRRSAARSCAVIAQLIRAFVFAAYL